jgi:hypothetical protein
MNPRAPALLTRKLSYTQQTEVGRWWAELARAERQSLRRDSGHRAPQVIARFVNPDQDVDNEDGPGDFYEHIVNHELTFEDGKKTHICSAHADARAVLAAGRIPAGFRCPRADGACLMRALLDEAPGCDVRLSLIPDSAPARDLRNGGRS